MTLCTQCGREFEGEAAQGTCPQCLRTASGVQEQAKSASGPAPEPGAGRRPPSARHSVRDKAGTSQALAQVRDALLALAREREQTAADERAAENRRAHPREHVSAPMDFAFVRDDVTHHARTVDVSRGGVRFVTDVPLEPGHVLRATIRDEPARGEAREPAVPAYARGGRRRYQYVEVRRVRDREDGTYEAGGRFIRRIGVDDRNRRRHARRPISSPVWYCRAQSDLLCKGRACDLSRGGIRVRVQESVPPGERMEVLLRTHPPAFAHADLRATVEVVRAVDQGPGACELGCRFTRLQALPVAEGEG